MPLYSFVPGQLEQGAGLLARATQDIKTQLDNLDAEVQQTKNAWTGDASTSYGQRAITWYGMITEMSQPLDTGSRRLVDIDETYMNAERRNSALMTP